MQKLLDDLPVELIDASDRWVVVAEPHGEQFEAVATVRDRGLHAALRTDHRSWLSQVERWFFELTAKKLRRGTHHTVADLRRDINDWVEHWNANPRPFVWRKPADEILDNLARWDCRTILGVTGLA